jgi:hypothetical protein
MVSNTTVISKQTVLIMTLMIMMINEGLHWERSSISFKTSHHANFQLLQNLL